MSKNFMEGKDEVVKIPEWAVHIIEDYEYDGLSLRGLLVHLSNIPQYSELSYSDAKKLQINIVIAEITNVYETVREQRYNVYDEFTDSFLVFNEDYNQHYWKVNEDGLTDNEYIEVGTEKELLELSPRYIHLLREE